MTIEVGDRVMFSRNFLRSTGQFTGWAPFAKGKVVALETLSRDCVLATIAWDGGDRSRANIANLIREDRRHLEAV